MWNGVDIEYILFQEDNFFLQIDRNKNPPVKTEGRSLELDRYLLNPSNEDSNYGTNYEVHHRTMIIFYSVFKERINLKPLVFTKWFFLYYYLG